MDMWDVIVANENHRSSTARPAGGHPSPGDASSNNASGYRISPRGLISLANEGASVA